MPSTVGAILLFVAVFVVGLLWATSGHTAETDGQGEVTGHPGKTS
jgi:hypothetical protein